MGMSILAAPDFDGDQLDAVVTGQLNGVTEPVIANTAGSAVGATMCFSAR